MNTSLNQRIPRGVFRELIIARVLQGVCEGSIVGSTKFAEFYIRRGAPYPGTHTQTHTHTTLFTFELKIGILRLV